MEYLTLPISRHAQHPCNSGSSLRSHVENFCRIRRPRTADVDALKELFYALVGKSGTESKRLISMALASNPYTPRSIAFFLAMEPVEIAAPMLLHSNAFGSSDLIAIMDQTGLDHAKVVSHRADTDLAVKKKIQEKLAAVAPAGGKVLKKKQNTSDTAAPVKSAATQRERKVTDTRDTPENLKSKPGILTAHEQILELARRGGKLGKNSTRENNGRPAIYPADFGKELLFIARSRHYREFAARVEDVCGLRASIVCEMIEEKNAGILACLLQVLNIPDYLAGRLLLLLCPVTGRDSRIFKNIMREFGKLNKEAATAFFCDLDPNFSLPDVLLVSSHTLKTNSDRRIRLNRETVQEKPAQDLVEDTAISIAG